VNSFEASRTPTINNTIASDVVMQFVVSGIHSNKRLSMINLWRSNKRSSIFKVMFEDHEANDLCVWLTSFEYKTVIKESD